MPRVFFIGGPAKSGTTWLQKMLDAHPQIACDGEGHFVDGWAPLLDQANTAYRQRIDKASASLYGGARRFPTLDADDLNRLLRTTIERTLRKIGDDCEVVGEKTPENVRHFTTLHHLFPAARFIEVIRDGRDCALSGWDAMKRLEPDWLRERFDDDFEVYAGHCAECWAYDIASGIEFQGPMLTVRYETLRCDPAGQLRRVFDFLDVADHADACVSGGTPEKMGAHYRGGPAWREDPRFTEEALRAFHEAAGELLAVHGYEVPA